jgi:murein DD-endopeptidase MepM/ murein hydrolase activator NlpD
MFGWLNIPRSQDRIFGTDNGTVSGNYVKILGANAHMKKSNVRLLQFVRKGEKIGEVGATRDAIGKPHYLRFSVTTILPHF